MKIKHTISCLAILLLTTSIRSFATDFNPLDSEPSADIIDANMKASLLEKIKQRNLSDDAQNITVVNRNGSVILQGTVQDDNEREVIDNLAEQCGYTDIKNELQIKPANK